MTAGHFIYIPTALLIGFVLGWIFAGRAAADAHNQDLKRREEKARKRGL
jgi:hypothetical protein